MRLSAQVAAWPGVRDRLRGMRAVQIVGQFQGHDSTVSVSLQIVPGMSIIGEFSLTFDNRPSNAH